MVDDEKLIGVLRSMKDAIEGLQRQSETLYRLATTQQAIIRILCGEPPEEEPADPKQLSEQARRDIEALERLYRNSGEQPKD